MINTIFSFGFGKDVNFGECVNFIDTDAFLNFNKDVVGYGYSLRNGIDANFSNKKKISITISTDSILSGIIEFKTENSKNVAEKRKKFRIKIGQTQINEKIPTLSSELKEIVLFFPKELNLTTADGTIPFIRFENISIC